MHRDWDPRRPSRAGFYVVRSRNGPVHLGSIRLGQRPRLGIVSQSAWGELVFEFTDHAALLTLSTPVFDDVEWYGPVQK